MKTSSESTSFIIYHQQPTLTDDDLLSTFHEAFDMPKFHKILKEK